jgi:coenzyme F420 hydrogenase subunit beta
MKAKECQELQTKVIDRGLCTLCGGCVGTCPYFVAYRGRIVVRDICDLSDGRCSAVCPRLSLDLDKISETIFGVPYAWDELGTVKTVFMTRSTDTTIKAKAQDAGTVTALSIFALEEGIIDSAVLTLFEDKSLPKGIVASTRDGVLRCASSSYIATPTIETFNRAAQNNSRKSIGVIGTPCQVLALAKMRVAPPDKCKNMDKLKLVIGLFCTWALSYPDFAQFLEKEMPDKIVKYDVPPHPANVLVIYTEKGHIDILLDKVLPFVRPACQVCSDLTSEFADISVGSGRREVRDWNTVIVRTDRGMRLIDAARKKGVIETRDIPEENLSRLKVASYNKKKRALSNIVDRTGSIDDLLYLQTESRRVKPLLEKEE